MKRDHDDGLPDFVELQVTTNFSFHRGASFPEEYVEQAAALGYRAIAITDHSSFAGIVRAHSAAKSSGIQLVAGCRLHLRCHRSAPVEREDAHYYSLLAYPTSRESYGNLCALITLGKRRAEKGVIFLELEDLFEYSAGLILTVIPPRSFNDLATYRYIERIGFYEFCVLLAERVRNPELLSLALVRNYHIAEERRFEILHRIAERTGISVVATNDVCYHISERKKLHDVLTCIHYKRSIDRAGYTIDSNAERYLKPREEMQRLFRAIPQALARTGKLAEFAQGFSLEELRYEYPDPECPPGKSPIRHLTERTLRGAARRYPQGIPLKVRGLLKQELSLIKELRYEKYFLTCYEIVSFARKREILCQGRGAAANSAVCFCLGITAVDPTQVDLLFARFVSRERKEPPDIDIDFEHERREEVIQYIYQKYGRAHAGLTCVVICYRRRSALREVGKVFGLSQELVDELTRFARRGGDRKLLATFIKEKGLTLQGPAIANTLSYAEQLQGFPRHFSQHVGGFVISKEPLDRTVPISNAAMPNRTIIEWDKDDIEELGMLKIDVLALGMLTCLRKSFALLNETSPTQLNLANLPREDPSVYEMISRSDTIGVFQIESRAQMSMLPRLKPRCFYDLVIEIAIIRPGPIQGNMVHPYLKRRDGREVPYYPDRRAKEILGKTLGVPLFQEQAMRLAIVLAQFSPDEAERLRRSMASWKRNSGMMHRFQERIISGMIANGYTKEFAQNCCEQLKGFSEYGFPESHAASFAHLAYASAWLKYYYPAEFGAALLNSQPMGFYQPAQIVRDMKEHGTAVLPADIQHSSWDCTLEPQGERRAVRLGLRLVQGLKSEQALQLVDFIKQQGPFTSLSELWRKMAALPGTKVSKHTLLTLAQADALRSLGLNRQQAVWQVSALTDQPLPLMSEKISTETKNRSLPPVTRQLSIFRDYDTTGLSLKGHPLEFVRDHLRRRSVLRVTDLHDKKVYREGRHIGVAGLVLIRQRPPTAKGVTFLTLEDETGSCNLIVKPKVFERSPSAVILSSAVAAYGKLQRIGNLIYVEASRIECIDEMLANLRVSSRDFH